MAHIKGEPQAQFRFVRESKKIKGAEENCWFTEQKLMTDPITFLDIFARGENFDQYFYYVLLLLVFGLLLI
jgi:hypothetical protein